MSQERESQDLGAMVARMVRALVRRAAEGDTIALEELARLEDLVPEAVTVAGHVMHASHTDAPRSHYSWGELAQVTGVSRQAAHRRHGRLPDTDTARWLLA